MKRIKCSKELMIQFLFDMSEASNLKLVDMDVEDAPSPEFEDDEEQEDAVLSLAMSWGHDTQGIIGTLFAGWLCGKGLDIGDVLNADFNHMAIEACLEILHGEPSDDSEDSKG